jgi:hypothetical protein
MRGTQLSRQWKIIRLIESRKKGITGMELANELEVPLRTVYRDLDAIQEAGFPVYTNRQGKNSHWKILDTFKKDFPRTHDDDRTDGPPHESRPAQRFPRGDIPRQHRKSFPESEGSSPSRDSRLRGKYLREAEGQFWGNQEGRGFQRGHQGRE